MENKGGNRAAEIAAKLAQLAKAVINVIKAAAAGGPYGAIAAAVKEALPYLIKAALYILAAIVMLSLIIFFGLPSVFFGYDSATSTEVKTMTSQAATLGGEYMNLEEFENTIIDSAVSAIVSDYEEDGTEIDKIVIDSAFTEEDLLWFIAINSVAHQQNLNEMSTAEIYELCSTRLSYSKSVKTKTNDDDSTTTTLKITIDKLDSDAWMEKLSFDEEAKTWAVSLHDLVVESDALNKYASYFEANGSNYNGDTGYTGGVEHGSFYDNTIDISGFTSPSTKNAHDLVAYVTQAWENNWGYVYGTVGGVLTRSMLDYKLEQYSDNVLPYKDFIENNWLGRRTADCIGLIKGYGWLDPDTLTIKYATNGMPDYGANGMHTAAVKAGAEHGTIDEMPEIPGLILWKNGHAGVYIGGGYAIEAMGTKYGVVKTEVNGRGWQEWYKLPYIEYD